MTRGHYIKPSIHKEFNFEQMVDKHYKLNDNKDMSNLFRLNWKEVGSAVATAGVVAIIGYVLKVGNIFILDWHMLLNTAVLTGCGCLLTSFLTTGDGKLVGVFPVK